MLQYSLCKVDIEVWSFGVSLKDSVPYIYTTGAANQLWRHYGRFEPRARVVTMMTINSEGLRTFDTRRNGFHGRYRVDVEVQVMAAIALKLTRERADDSRLEGVPQTELLAYPVADRSVALSSRSVPRECRVEFKGVGAELGHG